MNFNEETFPAIFRLKDNLFQILTQTFNVFLNGALPTTFEEIWRRQQHLLNLFSIETVVYTHVELIGRETQHCPVHAIAKIKLV